MFEFLRFELKYRLRQPTVWVFAGLFGLLVFAAVTTDAVSIGGGTGQTAIDSPFVITQLLTVMSTLAVVVVTAFVGTAVTRDFELNTYALFFTRPIRGRDYLLGRFTGAWIVSGIVMLGTALGMMIGTQMPWLDPERLVGFSLLPYVHTLAVFVLPNLLVTGAFFFAVATLTRRVMWAYVGVVVFFVVYAVSQTLVADINNEWLAALSDPFGLSALALSTRYWTPFERNTELTPLSELLLANRALWLALAGLTLAATVARFRLIASSSSGKSLGEVGPEPSQRSIPIPSVQLRYDPILHVGQLAGQFWLELRGIVRSLPFLVITLFGVLNVVGGALGTIDQMYGTPVYPVTQLMLRVLAGSLSLFLLIVITFFAGELVWRERSARLNEVYDALPTPSWLPMLAKLTALLASVAVLVAVGLLTSVGVQISKGFTHVELDLYTAGLFGVEWTQWMIIAVLAFVLQVIANNKWLGYGLMAVYFAVSAGMPAMGFEHRLYRYGSVMDAPYSDMNGYGHFIAPMTWFRVYWGLAAVVLVLIANLCWVRGTDARLRMRWRRARARVNRQNTALLGVAVTGFLCVLGFTYYNTNVLNTYQPSDESERLAAEYERRYKRYENLPQPRIVATDVTIDLEPHERRLAISGHHLLVNRTDESIEDLHVTLDPKVELVAFSLSDDALQHDDREIGYRIYRLDPPLAPGGKLRVEFDVRWEEQGFPSNGSNTDIVGNGTFFHNDIYVPHFGYNAGGELGDPNERRKRDLPERLRMPSIDDDQAKRNTYISTEADWIDFAATVSTSPDQFALAPGYLVRSWESDGRRYFRYEMDAPILNLWAVISGDYEVVRDNWNDVALEIYHHGGHGYNVDRMMDAMKKSLTYYSHNFSPYQHRQLRIVEFPRYQNYAQSLPNIIPYSESIGFIADLRDDEDIDSVFYVTAHEVAHQWWAHQVIGANVQGGTVLVETLAQYSALMVMEEEYGPEKMAKFLRYELDRYLQGRGGEQQRELPLELVENQPYIHYNKGSLVMYALREYLGEDVVNRVLAEFIADHKFQGAPYPTSRDLVAKFREAADPKYDHLIEDLFETITLYDSRALTATAKASADGHYVVSLECSIEKLRAGEDGSETAVELDDWIEIGVYGTDDAGEEITLYRQKHRIDTAKPSFTVEVAGEPVRAGIDPRSLLVDRNPDDNSKSVEIEA